MTRSKTRHNKAEEENDEADTRNDQDDDKKLLGRGQN